jgi:hypothetical protein
VEADALSRPSLEDRRGKSTTSTNTSMRTSLGGSYVGVQKICGWCEWPKGANEDEVLRWFVKEFAEDHGWTPITRRKLDIGFVNDWKASEEPQTPLVAYPHARKAEEQSRLRHTLQDLGRYAREVLATQDTHRFVQGLGLLAPDTFLSPVCLRRAFVPGLSSFSKLCGKRRSFPPVSGVVPIPH